MREFLKVLASAGLAAITAAALTSLPVRAQPTSPSSSSTARHIRAGLGLGLPPAARAGLTIPLDEPGILTLRYTLVEEFVIFSSPPESAWDLGVLYGRQVRGEGAYASIAAGLALVGGIRRGERRSSSPGWFGTTYYEKLPFHTVGIPAELDVGWTFSSAFGLGATVFANLNPEMSVGALTVNLLFGNLR